MRFLRFFCASFSHHVLLSALVLTSTRAAAQTPNVKYDWRAQALVETRDVSAGTTIGVAITNLNRICYDYTITLAQVAAVETSNAFASILLGTSAALETQPTKTMQDALKTTDTSAVARGLRGRANTVAPKDSAQLALAIARYERARDELGSASKKLNAVTTARNVAQKAIEAFYLDACKPNYRPDSSAMRSFWRGANSSILAFIDSASTNLTSASSEIASAKKTLVEANELLAQVKKNAAAPFLLANRGTLSDQDVLQAALGGSIDQAAKTAAQLKTESAESAAARVSIDHAIGSVSSIQSAMLRDNTESISGLIVATGKPEIPHMKNVKVEDKFEVSVHRRFRAFFTTGFLSSTLDEHKFERQNIPDSDSTTYSTFVDMRDARSLAFAPAIFTHMTLGSLADLGFESLSGVSVAISGGVAARSVNARISPDFLLGASLGVRDRVVLTAAWHTGRVEHLTIGTATDVRKVAVPTEVTREGAVGERWARGIAIAFSVAM